MFFITAIASLPSIVFNQTFRTDPDAYDGALAEVERIIEDGGYDCEYSMEILINYGHASADYDVCYVLAAYSASMEQRRTTIKTENF